MAQESILAVCGLLVLDYICPQFVLPWMNTLPKRKITNNAKKFISSLWANYLCLTCNYPWLPAWINHGILGKKLTFSVSRLYNY